MRLDQGPYVPPARDLPWGNKDEFAGVKPKCSILYVAQRHLPHWVVPSCPVVLPVADRIAFTVLADGTCRQAHLLANTPIPFPEWAGGGEPPRPSHASKAGSVKRMPASFPDPDLGIF